MILQLGVYKIIQCAVLIAYLLLYQLMQHGLQLRNPLEAIEMQALGHSG
jgi:hypothetical protein